MHILYRSCASAPVGNIDDGSTIILLLVRCARGMVPDGIRSDWRLARNCAGSTAFRDFEVGGSFSIEGYGVSVLVAGVFLGLPGPRPEPARVCGPRPPLADCDLARSDLAGGGLACVGLFVMIGSGIST